MENTTPNPLSTCSPIHRYAQKKTARLVGPSWYFAVSEPMTAYAAQQAFLPQPSRGAAFLQLFSQQAHVLSAQAHWSHAQSLQAQTVAHSHASHVHAHASHGQLSQQAAAAVLAVAWQLLIAVSLTVMPPDRAIAKPLTAITAAIIEIVLTINYPFRFRIIQLI